MNERNVGTQELDGHFLRRPSTPNELMQAGSMLRFDLCPAFPMPSSYIDEVSVICEQGGKRLHVMPVPSRLPMRSQRPYSCLVTVRLGMARGGNKHQEDQGNLEQNFHVIPFQRYGDRGLTPELSRAAKRGRLERIVRPHCGGARDCMNQGCEQTPSPGKLLRMRRLRRRGQYWLWLLR